MAPTVSLELLLEELREARRKEHRASQVTSAIRRANSESTAAKASSFDRRVQGAESSVTRRSDLVNLEQASNLKGFHNSTTAAYQTTGSAQKRVRFAELEPALFTTPFVIIIAQDYHLVASHLLPACEFCFDLIWTLAILLFCILGWFRPANIIIIDLLQDKARNACVRAQTCRHCAVSGRCHRHNRHVGELPLQTRRRVQEENIYPQVLGASIVEVEEAITVDILSVIIAILDALRDFWLHVLDFTLFLGKQDFCIIYGQIPFWRGLIASKKYVKKYEQITARVPEPLLSPLKKRMCLATLIMMDLCIVPLEIAVRLLGLVYQVINLDVPMTSFILVRTRWMDLVQVLSTSQIYHAALMTAHDYFVLAGPTVRRWYEHNVEQAPFRIRRLITHFATPIVVDARIDVPAVEVSDQADEIEYTVLKNSEDDVQSGYVGEVAGGLEGAKVQKVVTEDSEGAGPEVEEQDEWVMV